jgi:uncharacterized membrane protein
MSIATLVITLLRIIHIFGAVTWIGGAIFMASVLGPTVRAAGPEGGRFMMRMASFGQLSRVLTIASISTVTAGLLLYYYFSGGLQATWISSAHGITLTVGGIVGILALLHGIFVSGRSAAKMKLVADQILATQGPPAPELLKEAQMLGAKLGRGAMQTATIGSIALLLMAAAQTI